MLGIKSNGQSSQTAIQTNQPNGYIFPSGKDSHTNTGFHKHTTKDLNTLHLAIADVRVSLHAGLQHVREHVLSRAVWIVKHGLVGECSRDVSVRSERRAEHISDSTWKMNKNGVAIPHCGYNVRQGGISEGASDGRGKRASFYSFRSYLKTSTLLYHC